MSDQPPPLPPRQPSYVSVLNENTAPAPTPPPLPPRNRQSSYTSSPDSGTRVGQHSETESAESRITSTSASLNTPSKNTRNLSSERLPYSPPYLTRSRMPLRKRSTSTPLMQTTLAEKSPDQDASSSPADQTKNSEKQSSERRPSRKGSETESDIPEFQKSLHELEDMEIADYFKRAGRYLETVKLADHRGHREGAVMPSLRDFRDDATQQVDYRAFVIAVAMSLADEFLPEDFFVPTDSQSLTLAQSRFHMERLYVVLPLIERLVEGRTARIYRWQNPRSTGKILLAYIFLWYYDMIPAALTAVIVVSIIYRRIFPPRNPEVYKELQAMKQRSREADELNSDNPFSSTVQNQLSSDVVMDYLKDDNDEQSKTETGKANKIKSAMMSQASGAKQIYNLATDLGRRIGPTAQTLLHDTADACEKIKNLWLWRRPTATVRSLVVLAIISCFLATMSTVTVVRMFFFWLGMQFFAIFPMQDAYPRYRRVFNPFWWILYGVPNDAESVMDIMKKRKAEQRASQQSPDSTSGESSEQPEVKATPATKTYVTTLGMTPGEVALIGRYLKFTPLRGWQAVSSGFEKVCGRPGSTGEGVVQVDVGDIVGLRKVSTGPLGIIKGLVVTLRNEKALHFTKMAAGRDELFGRLAGIHNVAS